MLVYLKTNGVDPRTHPVMEEMKRVKKYMEKISEAERAKQQDTHARLDMRIANRFINNAIASVTAASSRQASGSKQTVGVIGNHLRFDVQGEALTDRAAAKIASRAEKDDEDEEDSDEDVLEVVGGTLGDTEEVSEPKVTGKGKEKAPVPSSKKTTSILEKATGSLSRAKRKRPHMDPFTGYSVDPALKEGNDGATNSGRATPISLVGDNDTVTGTEGSDAVDSGPGEGGKRKRRRRKKNGNGSKLKEGGGDGES